MKKIFALTLAAVMMLTMFTACGSSDDGGDAAGDTSTTTFKVGFDAEYPPYGYMDDEGNYTGFDLEMAQAVCEYYGWEYEAVPIDWDAKDMELDSGAIDCIWNGFTITGREDEYEWTIPYVDNSQVILTAADSGIQTAEDLAGKNVGVQAASSADTLVQPGGELEALAATFGELISFKDYNTAFVELQSGSIDAVIIDIGVAKYQVEERGEGKFVIADTVASEQYAIGFKKGNTELRDQVQEALLKLVADGTFGELAEKYELTDFVCLVQGENINDLNSDEETAE